jgi:hypothetical protein
MNRALETKTAPIGAVFLWGSMSVEALYLFLDPQLLEFHFLDRCGVGGRSVLFVIQSAVKVCVFGAERDNVGLKRH